MSLKRTLEVEVTAREMGVEWATASASEQVDMLVAAAQVMKTWNDADRDRQLLGMATDLLEAPIALTMLRDLMAFVDTAAPTGGADGKR